MTYLPLCPVTYKRQGWPLNLNIKLTFNFQNKALFTLFSFFLCVSENIFVCFLLHSSNSPPESQKAIPPNSLQTDKQRETKTKCRRRMVRSGYRPWRRGPPSWNTSHVRVVIPPIQSSVTTTTTISLSLAISVNPAVVTGLEAAPSVTFPSEVAHVSLLRLLLINVREQTPLLLLPLLLPLLLKPPPTPSPLLLVRRLPPI